MTTIVALSGPAGAGKSAIADYLVKEYGAKEYAFATPLKEICLRTLPFRREQFYGTQEEKEAIDPRFGFSARQFITKLGTEGIRSVFGEDVWAELTLKQIATDAPALAVISDCRFINEAKCVRSFDSSYKHGSSIRRSGYVWKIENPFAQSNADPKHQSEAEWHQVPHDAVIRPMTFCGQCNDPVSEVHTKTALCRDCSTSMDNDAFKPPHGLQYLYNSIDIACSFLDIRRRSGRLELL